MYDVTTEGQQFETFEDAVKAQSDHSEARADRATAIARLRSTFDKALSGVEVAPIDDFEAIAVAFHTLAGTTYRISEFAEEAALVAAAYAALDE